MIYLQFYQMRDLNLHQPKEQFFPKKSAQKHSNRLHVRNEQKYCKQYIDNR